MTEWSSMSRSRWAALTAEQREDWDEEACKHFAAVVAQQVGMAEPQLADDSDSFHDVDYRGRMGRYPARILLTEIGCADLQVKCPCDIGAFYLFLDAKSDTDPDFGSADEYVQVASRVFIVPPAREYFEALPPQVKDAAVAGMPMRDIHMLGFGSDEGITASTTLTPSAMASPVDEVADALRFISTLAHLMNEEVT